MDSRFLKQVLYGAFYAGIWIAIFAGIYFWSTRPVPTCYDGIQNQGEQGVDCGGPCAIACVPANVSAISTVGPVYVFVGDSTHVTLLAQVQNTNVGFAVPSFNYRFDLFTASNTLVQSVSGQSFMYSGELKWLLAPNVAVAQSIDHAALVVWNAQWVDAKVMGIVPQFTLQNLGVVPAPTGTQLFGGELKNNDLASFDNILVIGVLKGPSGLPAGASQTVLDHIGPSEVRDFNVMYPSTALTIDPSLTQFYAYAVRK